MTAEPIELRVGSRLAEFLDHVPRGEMINIAGTSDRVAGNDNNSFSLTVTDFLSRVIAA